MTKHLKIWCDNDEHNRYEYFADFNEWFDSDEAQAERMGYKVDGISQPSKAFYAGDKEAYDQAFKLYRDTRRDEVLNQTYFSDQFNDNHWFDKNLSRFDQLTDLLEGNDVVPFIGAGLSVGGGFPTWKDHLRQQARTAAIDINNVEKLLSEGRHEDIIEEIERIRGQDVFIGEVRDVFSQTGTLTDTTLLISELFADTVITTNYDRLLEKAYSTGIKNAYHIITGADALKAPIAGQLSLIKLHGDITHPAQCILSKSQYDAAYGADKIDMMLPIPKLLEYYYTNSSLLFLGCSLQDDRTIHVFRAIKEKIGEIDLPQHFSIEQAPETEEEMADRNAFLARLGITGIWFEKGCFEYVDDMLRLARNELRYRGVLPRKPRAVDSECVVTDDKAEETNASSASSIKSLLNLIFFGRKR